MTGKSETSNFISLMSDTTIKYLFKNEDTKDWFIDLIKKITNIDLTGYLLIDNESNTGNKKKDYRQDLVFQKNDTIVILEINHKDYKTSTIKGYQYLYRRASRQYDTGSKYTKKYTKLIMFCGYLNPDKKDIKISHYQFIDQENQLEIEDIESYEIYLPKFRKTCYNQINRKLIFFSCKSFEEMKSIAEEEDMKIIEEMERLSMNEEFRDEYDYENVQRKIINTVREDAYEEGIEKGIKAGIEKGMKKGIKTGILEANKKNAIAMLKDNVDIYLISKYTGLSVDKIKSFTL